MGFRFFIRFSHSNREPVTPRPSSRFHERKSSSSVEEDPLAAGKPTSCIPDGCSQVLGTTKPASFQVLALIHLFFKAPFPPSIVCKKPKTS
ncbi:hypothetical protein KSP40_PGU006993 [Platanthera guangdongensis]|uniref:Uncharacterized protein n=1 Tax=Platanthera guangdongensis TaxID=2320717 RepID=A0ABR2LNL6_9ASPA